MVEKINGTNQQAILNQAKTIEKALVQKKINTVFGDNKTKTVEREVDGRKTTIIVGENSKGEKVRLDADTGEELIEKTTAGKNTYVTKSELEKQVTEQTGMTLQELKDNNIIPQFRHGQLVFVTPNGENANDLIKDLQNQRINQAVNEAIDNKATEIQADITERWAETEQTLKDEAAKAEQALKDVPNGDMRITPQGATSPTLPEVVITPNNDPPQVVTPPKKPLAERIANKPHSKDAVWFKAKDYGNGGLKDFQGKTPGEIAKTLDKSADANSPLRNENSAEHKAFKQQIIAMNPSVFDKDGNIKKDADWNKLDIPNAKWVDEEYFGVAPTADETKPEKPVKSQGTTSTGPLLMEPEASSPSIEAPWTDPEVKAENKRLNNWSRATQLGKEAYDKAIQYGPHCAKIIDEVPGDAMRGFLIEAQKNPNKNFMQLLYTEKHRIIQNDRKEALVKILDKIKNSGVLYKTGTQDRITLKVGDKDLNITQLITKFNQEGLTPENISGAKDFINLYSERGAAVAKKNPPPKAQGPKKPSYGDMMKKIDEDFAKATEAANAKRNQANYNAAVNTGKNGFAKALDSLRDKIDNPLQKTLADVKPGYMRAFLKGASQDTVPTFFTALDPSAQRDFDLKDKKEAMLTILWAGAEFLTTQEEKDAVHNLASNITTNGLKQAYYDQAMEFINKLVQG